jgi:hypothetical protein
LIQPALRSRDVSNSIISSIINRKELSLTRSFLPSFSLPPFYAYEILILLCLHKLFTNFSPLSLSALAHFLLFCSPIIAAYSLLLNYELELFCALIFRAKSEKAVCNPILINLFVSNKVNCDALNGHNEKGLFL